MSALLVSTGVVALAEIGDKTQLATVALAARYDALVPVVLGTTLGTMAASVPVVRVGEVAARALPVPGVRLVAAAVFAGPGIAVLLGRSLGLPG